MSSHVHLRWLPGLTARSSQEIKKTNAGIPILLSGLNFEAEKVIAEILNRRAFIKGKANREEINRDKVNKIEINRLDIFSRSFVFILVKTFNLIDSARLLKSI